MHRKQITNKPDSVSFYLKEIGRIPLLTHEQEIDCSRSVQKAIALKLAKEDLAQQLQREPTNQEWADCVGMSETQLMQFLHEGERAKRKMIEANLRLVVSIAKKYQKRNMEFLDLIQEGALGLERGVEKFDPTRGYKFSTYAYWWIRQAITRAIAQQSRTIRLPIHIIEKLNQIKKVQRELAQKLGRIPNLNEISRELEISPDQVREYLRQGQNPTSLDFLVGKESDTPLGNFLEDYTASNAEDHAIFLSLRNIIAQLIAELPPQQAQVLSLRFGLADGEPHSLAEIGNLLKLSRERIRQIECQGLAFLRSKKARLAGWY